MSEYLLSDIRSMFTLWDIWLYKTLRGSTSDLSVCPCTALGATLISLRRFPDSNTSSLPVSVPAITRSAVIQAWHRKLMDSTFGKLLCFRAPSA